MNENTIGINTDDLDPKIDVHMGVHSAHLVPYVNEPTTQVYLKAKKFGVSADATCLVTLDFETDVVKVKNSSLSGHFAHQKPDFCGTSIPMRTAVQQIEQGSWASAFEEAAERERRAKGIKQVIGPRGPITWPTVVVRPGKPHGLGRR